MILSRNGGLCTQIVMLVHVLVNLVLKNKFTVKHVLKTS